MCLFAKEFLDKKEKKMFFSYSHENNQTSSYHKGMSKWVREL